MKGRGFALIMALAIAMVCFLLAAGMVAISRTDLESSIWGASRNERYFAARAQIQTILALIKGGHQQITDLPDQSNPGQQTVEGVPVTYWAEKDPNLANVYHIYALAGNITSMTTVKLGGNGSAASFAGIVDNTLPSKPVINLMAADESGTWTSMPPLPNYSYASDGSQVAASGASQHYVADDQGFVYILTRGETTAGAALFRHVTTAGSLTGNYGSPPAPGFTNNSWQDLGSFPKVIWDAGYALDTSQNDVSSDNANDGESWVVTRSGSYLYDRINFGPWAYPPGGDKTNIQPVIRRLDLATNTWSLIEGPPNTVIGAMAGGVNEGVVAAVGSWDPNQLKFNQLKVLSGSTWSDLPTPLVFTDIQGVAVAPDGKIYVAVVECGDYSQLFISQYAKDPTTGQGSWSDIPAPAGFKPQNGYQANLISVDSKGNLICLTGEDSNGSKQYAVLRQGQWIPFPPPNVQPGEAAWSVIGAGAAAAGQGGSSGLVQTFEK